VSELFADLLAVQMEVPNLQKKAINPFFSSKYVTLDDVIHIVLPILNKHNFVLLQQPTEVGGSPALRTVLMHSSGEVLESTMLLQVAKDDPQGQGSGITYGRRYAILAWLGLTADADDDAEATRQAPAIRGGQERPTPPSFRPSPAQPIHAASQGSVKMPSCPQGHGPMKFWPAGKSKAGKEVGANYKCTNRDCKNDAGWPYSVWASDWEDELQREGSPVPAGMTQDELDKGLPFE